MFAYNFASFVARATVLTRSYFLSLSFLKMCVGCRYGQVVKSADISLLHLTIRSSDHPLGPKDIDGQFVPPGKASTLLSDHLIISTKQWVYSTLGAVFLIMAAMLDVILNLPKRSMVPGSHHAVSEQAWPSELENNKNYVAPSSRFIC